MKNESVYRKVCVALAAVLLVSLWSVSALCAEQKPAPAGPSLYERVGGINNIAVLIDDVIERSYVNEVFRANPEIEEAHKRYPKAAYKFNATALACMVMGGPQKYTGRSLKDAHQHLKVNEREWQELFKIFRDSMSSFKVPEKEQAEILGIIDSTRGDIVVPLPKAAAR
jgi:hemoglobin